MTTHRWRAGPAVLSLCLLPAAAAAQEPAPGLVEQSSASIAYLVGLNWRAPRSSRDVITFEYANRWRLGDTFFFLDVSNLATRQRERDGSPAVRTEMYAELQPRVSLGRLLGRCFCAGPIADVLTAHELNFAGSGLLARLHGAGLSWRIPGIPLLKTNLYWRDNADVDGSTWQFLVAGQAPIRLGARQLHVGGFIDLTGAEGPLVGNVFAAIQLLLDLGAAYGQPSQLLAGVELHASINHLGREGLDQYVPQLMVKWAL